MIQRLAGLLLLLALVWWIRRILGGRPARAAAPREPAPPEEPMVRDRVCNTFLPRSRAVIARIDGEEHFFCSDKCRRLAVKRTAPAGSGA